MSEYKVPLRDIQFIRDELLQFPEHYKKIQNHEEATPDIVSAILEESARFCEEKIAPLNAIGDEQGCTLQNHEVKTPDGFKEAYQQYIENGWGSISHDPQWGGQGLPESLSVTVNEMMASANWAWNMYPGLSHGAILTLLYHGNEKQKKTYLPSLVSGQWTGTMCLTEPHCGSDLGLLKTKAIYHQKEDSYTIEGSKIFISSGEHDLADNIIHIVLARIEGAPQGTKGISLFIVPKWLVSEQGEKKRNHVYCGGLEKKMGIHGNATCTLNFEGATGFLIGPPNKGLSCMFTFMNFARLGTALQGLAHAEVAWQGAWNYTNERRQGKNLNEVAAEVGPVLLVQHPDIRRHLMTIGAFTEGARAFYYYTCKMADIALYTKEKDEKESAEKLLEFLTPICKAFITETSLEAANLGMQCLGGHGYIREYGMEQNVRDARISTIYEGTSYIQSLDLLGRKVLMSQGDLLRQFTKIVHKFCKAHEQNENIKHFIKKLQALNKMWGDITMAIGMKAMNDRQEVGAAAYDYMMLSGYICYAWVWCDMARVSYEALLKKQQSDEERLFYQRKIDVAHFYFARILPRIEMHKMAIESGLESLSLTI